MPTEIGLTELKALLENGAQVVEVLPAQEFEEEHLPGAISIPLKELNEHSTRVLKRDVPVIVYCWDDR